MTWCRYGQRVGTRVDMLPFLAPYVDAQGTSEAVFAPRQSSLYELGPPYRRYLVDGLSTRVSWANACARSAGADHFTYGQPLPLITLGPTAAPTAHLKPCYDPTCDRKARLSFDLDASDNAASLPLPSAQQIMSVMDRFLMDHMVESACENTIDFADEPCLVFLGRNHVKDRTVHVIYPFLSFERIADNRLGKAHPLCAELNDMLKPLGLVGDFSICNSGLRWEFTDKFDGGQFRGAVNALYAQRHESITEKPWLYIASRVDPHVYEGDDAWERECKWILPRKRQATEVTRVVAQVSVTVPGTPEEMICAAVPQLKGVQFVRIQQPTGVLKLEPRCNFCPFKDAPSDNMPAHQHAGNKLYAYVRPSGKVDLHCAVCVKKLVLQAPEGDHMDIIEAYNSKYARVGHSNVLVLPVTLQDGTLSGIQVLKKQEFEAGASDQKGKIKINGTKYTEAQYWYTHERSTKYPLGILYDPSRTCDPRYYNSFTGFNPLAEKAAAEFADLSTAQLEAKFPNLRELILANLCNNDKDLAHQVLLFFADMLVNPGRKPHYGIAMYGPQGCGKGLTAQFFLNLVGLANGVHGDADIFTSQYNAVFVDKLFIFGDESVSAKDEVTAARMKKLITEGSVMRRQKYRDDGEVKTCMRFMLASNGHPVALECKERRWMVLNCDYRKGSELDASWRQLVVEVAKECNDPQSTGAFLAWARKIDLSAFDFSTPPRTQGRWRLQFEQFTPYMRFWYKVLCSEELAANFDGMNNVKYVKFGGDSLLQCFGKDIPKSLVWDAFSTGEFMEAKCNNVALWKFLRKLGDFKDTQLGPEYGRVYMVTIPKIDAARLAFAEHIGQPVEIFSTWKLE